MGKKAPGETKAVIDLFLELTRLKAVPRMGWLLRGVRDVESVAAHSYSVAVVAMLLADRAKARGIEVDAAKVLRMALLHDLTEARTGDLPNTIKAWFDPAALRAADARAAGEMLDPLGTLGAEYLEFWSDYERRSSLEARLVKAADKIDLLVQALEYEKGGARSLDEFWSSTDFNGLGLDDLVSDLIEELKERRGAQSNG
ncbi:MAG: HD family hydrolase [Acidobacteriota bacterium]|nr:MAG: HD family hydrolase [Acidobacteriota bacterium]